jgi:tetratricopeptide (TPR) repeat protein
LAAVAILFAAMASAAVATPQDSSDGTVDKLLKKAEKLEKSGELRQAGLTYVEANEAAGGRSWEAQMGLGRLYLRTEGFQKAFELAISAREVAASPAQEVESIELAGHAYEGVAKRIGSDEASRQVELLAEAAALFEEAVSISPETAIAPLYSLGTIKERLGDLETAADLYRRYIEMAPEERREGARLHLEALGRAPEERPRFVSGSIVPPRKLTGAQPAYTEDARRARVRVW